jgi:hypothetical protein
MADKAIGLSYETGMNLAGNTDEVGEDKSKKKKDFCKYCGATTHKTRRSKSCKYNGWTDLAVNAEMVSINLSKATEQAVEVATVGGTSEVQSEGKWEGFGISCDTYNMKLTSTQSSHVFYTEESENGEENACTVENRHSPEAVEEPVENALATIRAEILDLDTMGFDEKILLSESVDI